MIALIDYGAGNVRSVQKALETVGATIELTRDPGPLAHCEKMVLPGVGAFGDCMVNLRRTGLAEGILTAVEQGIPLLGICVGLQVLFEEGTEMGRHNGLGLLPGQVERFDHRIVADGLKIPHTGWNQVVPTGKTPLFRGLPPGAWAYFNHAFYGRAQTEHVLAVTEYGEPFPSAVGLGHVYGIQFHPEKSADVGLRIMQNFVELVR